MYFLKKKTEFTLFHRLINFIWQLSFADVCNANVFFFIYFSFTTKMFNVSHEKFSVAIFAESFIA